MKHTAKQRQKKLERKARKRSEQLRAKKERGGGSYPLPALPFDSVKMSDVIVHVAEPILKDYGNTPETVRRIISLTITAWNLAVLPEDKREDRFQKSAELVCVGDPEYLSVFRWMCDLVAERKRRYYPDLNRLIADFQFSPGESGGIHLSVMSLVSPTEGARSSS
jgi:hypothetical protein